MARKALGLDLGTRTCGIAISDSLGIAHGKEEFRFAEGDYEACLFRVVEIIEEEGIGEVALGYPLHMNGSNGEGARRSERFRDELLSMKPDLKVFLIDERLTTVMATRFLLEADLSRGKRKKVIDKQSAIVILEDYLAKRERGIL